MREQPCVNFGHTVDEEGQVPILLGESSVNTRYVLREPFAMREWDEQVVPAMPEQNRDAVSSTGKPQVRI